MAGWKGLINDPGMDAAFDVHRGLRLARRLLLDIVDTGLPMGCEWLDTITPQYIADTVTWGAIGARTTESQVHRQLSSGLSMPVGSRTARTATSGGGGRVPRRGGRPHVLRCHAAGAAAVVTTAGNPDTHLVLRGGRNAPNYDADSCTRRWT